MAAAITPGFNVDSVGALKIMPSMLKSFTRLCKGLAVFASLLLPLSLSAGTPLGLLDANHPAVRTVLNAQQEVTAGWMQTAGVLGTAVGLDADGNPALVVYVDRDEANAPDIVRSFPAQTRGVNVRVELTDKFRAMAGGPGKGHTAKQTAPIQLGTSGGWTYDLANGFCCGGTLGALVNIGGVQHILSNYHVFEADITSGGNGRTALTGDPIIQPGLIDVNCSSTGTLQVGTLVKKSSLPGSNVDCSIAKVISGQVDTSGAILEIGTISSSTVNAALNQKVKKSGRTTGLTRSSISGLNATISVTYDNECAGGTAFTKTFTGQIVVTNRGSKFLDSGDSGSLMVEDITTNPRAVGLLFAGSSSTAIANPIGQVLSFLGATMVGN